ncbi:MAG: MFS transporter [Mycobacterium sp.]
MDRKSWRHKQMLRALAGRRRTTAVSLACAIWAVAWSLALLFGYAGDGWFAVAGFILAMVVFGIAETALSPTLPAIVNDLAPDHLRGRYNGVSALGWTTGFFVGPAIAGFALGADAGGALLAVLVGGCGVAALWAARLGRRLPKAANIISH